MMSLQLARLGLAPILLAQGRRVRRTTPDLPEPPGPRAGQTGQGPVLRLLILGDSAAAGVGASHQQAALSGQLVARLAAHFTVHWQLLATTGHTTLDALKALGASAFDEVDVVVTSLGVNDVTAGVAPPRWRQQQLRLLDALQQQLHPRLIVLTAVPPMHLFPALPQPLRWFLGAWAQQLNHQQALLVTERAGCCRLAPTFPPGQAMMAADGFHPGESAYQLWAEQAALAILASQRQEGACS